MEVLERNFEKVGIVGSGGREHVMAATIAQHPDVEKVYGFPGNPGFDDMIEKGVSVPQTNVKDHDGIVSYARQEGINFMIVGPETPLIADLVGRLRAEGITTMGPTGDGARFEGSKIFTQKFNDDNGIWAPKGFDTYTPEEAVQFLANHKAGKWVMKADGEAAGKGALVPDNMKEAIRDLARLLDGDLSEAALSGILWQRRLRKSSPEVSDYNLIDINGNIMHIGAGQDHKRRFNGDAGPNTGGMGAYSPVPKEIYGKRLQREQAKNVEKFVEGCKKAGIDFDGVLFSGLMLAKHAYVLEYNVRFGDPEAQVVLPQIGGYLLELLYATATGTLDQMAPPEPSQTARVCVALCSDGYPDNPKTGYKIRGLDQELDEGEAIYVGGVKKKDGNHLTSGGRVAYAVGEGATHEEAREKAHRVAARIKYHRKQIRTDIAHQAIPEAA